MPYLVLAVAVFFLFLNLSFFYRKRICFLSERLEGVLRELKVKERKYRSEKKKMEDVYQQRIEEFRELIEDSGKMEGKGIEEKDCQNVSLQFPQPHSSLLPQHASLFQGIDEILRIVESPGKRILSLPWTEEVSPRRFFSRKIPKGLQVFYSGFHPSSISSVFWKYLLELPVLDTVKATERQFCAFAMGETTDFYFWSVPLIEGSEAWQWKIKLGPEFFQKLWEAVEQEGKKLVFWDDSILALDKENFRLELSGGREMMFSGDFEKIKDLEFLFREQKSARFYAMAEETGYFLKGLEINRG